MIVQLDVIIPTKEGQICRLLNPMEDENPSDIYIVVENPTSFDADDNIYVVNVRELQRNLGRPELTPQIAVLKNELTVISDNLNEYIKTWNSPDQVI